MSSDGLVTAVGNGITYIIVSQYDEETFTDNYAMCEVTVNAPIIYEKNISLAGGKSTTYRLTKTFLEANHIEASVKDFTFTLIDNNGILTMEDDTWSASPDTYKYGVDFVAVSFKAYRAGTAQVVIKRKGKIFGYINIEVTSTWTDYYDYIDWMKEVEAQIWTAGMSKLDKMVAADSYIFNNFEYGSNGYGHMVAHKPGMEKIDCIDASAMLADFAVDAGCTAKFYNHYTGLVYDELVKAYSASGGHISNIIFVDGQGYHFDACPFPND